MSERRGREAVVKVNRHPNLQRVLAAVRSSKFLHTFHVGYEGATVASVVVMGSAQSDIDRVEEKLATLVDDLANEVWTLAD